MSDFNPNIAYITLPDGRRVQVLNADGTDWDEAATAAEAAKLLAEKKG